ncbi:MAG: regulatory iron-sulfur-containing complex subunit RicT [Parcubacteria group bacterium]|jgi:cell fate regulator YaaT (PSP1 superfamily)
MAKYLVSLYSWENPRLCFGDVDLAKGDKVIIEGEFGNDLGNVLEIGVETKNDKGQPIVRVATPRDIEAFKKNEEKKEELLKVCKSEIKRLELKMKLIDARIGLDGSNVVIIFTADERVDFRELVKTLAKIFHRSVRMLQIGSRDEARRLGGCGICGRELCCVKFPGDIPSISTEMARVQQVASRGSDRISGVCGRLMCCLSYEAKQYQEILSGMPEIGSVARIKEGKGQVLELDVVKQEVKLRMEGGKIKIVKKEEIK